MDIGSAQRPLQLRTFRAERSNAELLFLPGAACDAQRYDWLGALTRDGIAVHVMDAQAGNSPGATSPPWVHSDELAMAIACVGGPSRPVFVGGHSRGAATVLDWLEQIVEQAGLTAPIGQLPAGVAAIGCSLQSRVLDMELPHRSDDRALRRPSGMPLLFLSGTHDRVAPPPLMYATYRRFAPPRTFLTIKGATHYGWAEGQAESDNAQFDAPGDVNLENQRARSCRYLASWILTGVVLPVGGDTAAAI